MRKLTSTALLMLTAVLLAGCPRQIREPEAPAEPAPEPAADTRGATIYHVDPQQSRVLIHVFRGGKLSRLGHNHVVASKTLSGRAWIHPTFAKSGFELSFAVAQLIVDDPGMRQAAGADFASQVSEADKEGTRKNMLRADVLDAERYPEITLRSARIGGSVAAPQVTAQIRIRGAAHDAEVPTKIQLEGAQLRATGEFDVNQTDFGIKPFSVALGALEVQDRLRIEFQINAQKADKLE